MVPITINPCIVGSQISEPVKKGSGDLSAATRRVYHDKDKSKDNAYRGQLCYFI